MADGSNKFKNSINLNPQSSDPSNPAEGDVFRSDGTSRTKGLWEYKDGAWVEVGSGSGSGGINYLEGDNNSFESSVGDWVAYADAAGTEPVDGTGGSPTITIVKSADTSLRGDSNGLITKDAADRQGEGASCAFTIDEADKAKKLTISFDYTTSANYADDDIKIFVYDVTNANLIRVNGEDLKAISGQSTHYAQFQTAPDSTSYRLIIHQSTDDATAYTVRIDNVKVGPTSLVKGAIITDWKESDLTFADVLKGQTSNPTIATSPDLNKIWYRRVGDEIQIKGKYRHTNNTGAAAGSGSYYFDFSSFGAIDLNKFARLGNRTGQHYFSVRDTTGAYDGQLNDATETDAAFFLNSTQSTTDARQSNVGGSVKPITATDYTLSFYVAYPVQGWSSNAVMSEDLGGREVSLLARKNTALTLTAAAFTTISAWDESTDSTNSFNTTTGVYTVPESGYYTISGAVGVDNPSSGTEVVAIYKNGAEFIRGVQNSGADFTSTDSRYVVSVASIELQKGDTVSLRYFSNSGGTTDTFNLSTTHLSIHKLASPQTILETETVAARYNTISAQEIGNNTDETVVYDSLIEDTHNAMNTTTGVYTIPVSGWYHISANVTYSALSVVPGTFTSGIIRINDSFNIYRNSKEFSGTNSTSVYSTPVSTIYYLEKGDTVEIQTYQSSGGNENLAAQPERNTFSIARIK